MASITLYMFRDARWRKWLQINDSYGKPLHHLRIDFQKGGCFRTHRVSGWLKGCLCSSHKWRTEKDMKDKAPTLILSPVQVYHTTFNYAVGGSNRRFGCQDMMQDTLISQKTTSLILEHEPATWFGFQSGSYTLVRLDHISSFWHQKRQWVVLSPFHQPLQPRTSSSLTVVPWLQSKVVSWLQPLTSSMDGSFRFNLVGGGSIECWWRAQTFAIPVFFFHLGILRAHPRFHTSLYWSWWQQDSDCVAVSLNCTRFQSHSRSLKIQTSTFHWLNIAQ